MKRYFIVLSIFLFSFIFFKTDINNRFINNKSDIELIHVESGSFDMGSNDFFHVERPIHNVSISNNFYISKYEITNQQVADVFNWAYQNKKIMITKKGVVSYGGDEKVLLDLFDKDCQIKFKRNKFRVKWGKKDFPCIEISWYGALAFCNFLSEKELHLPSYNYDTWDCTWSINSYRLPTEAEWEFASSGGMESENFEFSGTDDPVSTGWFDKNSSNKTHRVGMKKPNELGLHDMSGNVWEWCWDWYNQYYYYVSPDEDPKGPEKGINKIIRGGSWYLNVYNGRNTSRLLTCNPEATSHHGGFRIVKVTEVFLASIY